MELDVHDLATIAEFSKSHGDTVTSGTTSTANAVGVIFSFHRQAEVEHVGHGGHVNTASGHVRCHQNLHLTLTQCHQTTVTQALAQRTVQSNGRETFLLQVIGQAIALDLGAGENNRLVDGGVAQPMVEQFAFVLGVVSPEQLLADVLMLFLWAVDLQTLRFSHHTGCKLLNTRRKRGAEHHGLLAANGQLIDISQVIGEAQVQHTVGFVNHQELNLVQFDLHGALQVKQTTGCRHHEVGILQLGNLQLVRHTTHNIGNTQTAAMLNQIDRIVCHLLGQFAGGANNQGARCSWCEMTGIGRVFALGTLWRCLAFGSSVSHGLLKIRLLFGFGLRHLHQQGVQHGQQEGSSFAATGLARYHQIGKAGSFVSSAVALHGDRNRLQLHCGGLGKSQVFNRLDQLRRQAQRHKAVRQFSDWLDGLNSVSLLDNVLRHLGSVIGKIFDKRYFARRLNSVSHEFTHTRAPQGLRLLRQWLKNINHQTEPALTHKEFYQRWGPFYAMPLMRTCFGPCE